jgi:hypothetical protein
MLVEPLARTIPARVGALVEPPGPDHPGACGRAGRAWALAEPLARTFPARVGSERGAVAARSRRTVQGAEIVGRQPWTSTHLFLR